MKKLTTNIWLLFCLPVLVFGHSVEVPTVVPPSADECIDATLTTLNTNLESVVTLDECAKATLDMASPETFATECGIGNGPTVWFAYEIDDDAAQFFVEVNTDDGSWQPSMAIFKGPDCNNLSQLGNCNSTHVHSVGVSAQTVGSGGSGMIWVAITAKDPSTIIDPDFTICASTTIKFTACLGGEAPDYEPHCDPDATFKVVARSNDPDGALGLALDGPFCPGETVRVCWDFFYDASITAQDWLQGIIPIFGTGFDLANFDHASLTHAGTGGVPQWFPQNTTRIKKDIPNVCVHDEDGDGILNICNKFCQACPCPTPMRVGTYLPGGWFWLSNGGAGCINNGIPETMFGIGQNTANITDFCFDLKIKDFPDEASCIAADFTVGFQTFSNAATGCWDDPQSECLNDVAQISSDLVTVVCEFQSSISTSSDSVAICSGETVSAILTNEDGINDLIWVAAIDNPNVLGESVDGVYIDNMSMIPDTLTVVDSIAEPQVVTYLVKSGHTSGFCDTTKTVVTVMVYPQLTASINQDQDTICRGDCVTLAAELSGGLGGPRDYLWTGDQIDTLYTAQISVCPDQSSSYSLIVADSVGCMQELSTEVVIRDSLLVELPSDQFKICKTDDGLNDSLAITASRLGGTPPFQYAWVASNGLIGSSTGSTYVIDEQSSSHTIDSLHTLDVIITDANGCSASTSCSISLTDLPTVEIMANDPAPGVSVILIKGRGTANPQGLPIVSTSLWVCDDRLVAESNSDSVVAFVNLLDFSPPCFYIQTEDEAGCIARTMDRAIIVGTEDIIEGSSTFHLLQNSPNPFDQVTSIDVYAPHRAEGLLTIHDVTGRTLAEYRQTLVTGMNTFDIHTDDLGTAGVLFYTLQTQGFSDTKLMVLLK